MKLFAFSRALTKISGAFCAGAFCVSALLLVASGAHAATYVVNTVTDDADSSDINPGDGSCSTGRSFFEVVNGDEGQFFRLTEECTLRAAIEESNATEERDTILFEIAQQSEIEFVPLRVKPAAVTAHRIVLSSLLPVITRSATIDGYNRTDGNFNGTLNTAEIGWNGELAIEIDGGDLRGSVLRVNDLFVQDTVTANVGTIIQHLSIFRGGVGGGAGIQLQGSSGQGSGGHRVRGCFIGLDANGALVSDNNSTYGVRVEAPECVIGRSADGEPQERCVISDQNEAGVSISNSSNTVRDVYFGLDPAGLAALGSQEIGVHIGFDFGSDDSMFAHNRIENNVFGGHTICAIRLSPDTGITVDRTRISGNIIGLNATQTAAIPNERGIELQAFYDDDTRTGEPNEYIFDTTIGVGPNERGPASGEGNVIAGNTLDGIFILASSDGLPPFFARSNIEGVYIAENNLGLSESGETFRNGFHAINATFVENLQIGFQENFDEEGTISYGNTIRAERFGVLTDRVSQLRVEQNTISGNGVNGQINHGVSIERATGTTTVVANDIRGFSDSGIWVRGADYLDIQENLIERNDSHGVVLFGDIFEAEVIDNTIGSVGNGNSRDGLHIISTEPISTSAVRPARIFSPGTLVRNNSIKGNTGNGIFVGATTQNVQITENSISNNFRLGIDLQRTESDATGTVTPNDPAPDAPVGGNGTPNFPVLSSVSVSGNQLNIGGLLTSAPNTSYRLEFFYNANDDEEGNQFLFAQNVTTNGVGDANFAFGTTLGSAISGGSFTATATRVAEESYAPTSEFSAPIREAVADLQVTQTVSPSPVQVGSEAVFTINVRNNGPSTATNVVLTANLPSNVTFVSASSGTVSSGILTANLGSIPNGETRVVTIRVRTNSAGTFTNIADATSDVRDSNDENNDADATGEAVEGDIEITPDLRITRGKLARIGPYVPGLFNRTRFYGQTLTLRNLGPSFNGPIRVFIRDLPSSATLQNATGRENGVPFIQITPGSDNVFSTGETLKITLRFESPRATPTYNISVFAEGLAPAPPLNGGKKRRK